MANFFRPVVHGAVRLQRGGPRPVPADPLLAPFVYVIGTTGFGELISSFVRTQVAAVSATAILSMVTAVNFSGPVRACVGAVGGARLLGLSFPSCLVFAARHSRRIHQALGYRGVMARISAMAAIALVFPRLCCTLLRKQERARQRRPPAQVGASGYPGR